MSFLRWLLLGIEGGGQYCSSSDSKGIRHWEQCDLPHLSAMGRLKPVTYLESVCKLRCCNLHDQSLFMYLLSEMTAYSLIMNVNANAVAQSEFWGGYQLVLLTGYGHACPVWSLQLAGRSKMVPALDADAFAVCIKASMNQGVARALLNSSSCITANDVMEYALNYGPVSVQMKLK